MCGIVALLRMDGRATSSRDYINCHAAVNSLHHRGPDSQQTEREGKRFILGHSRLAIVDVAGGNQPFVHNDIYVIANGEIYNHEALRSADKKFQFQTKIQKLDFSFCPSL